MRRLSLVGPGFPLFVWTKRHTSSSDSDDAGRGNRCFDGGVLSVQRAADLAVELDLDVDQTGVCFACLSFVSFALDGGDEREIRRHTLRMTPDLWEEGLALPARLALERARARGVKDAELAIADVDQAGPKTTIARAIVRQLAHQLSVRARAALN
jgi:hypothetical protein